jgi:hyperosmotically inducible protein
MRHFKEMTFLLVGLLCVVEVAAGAERSPREQVNDSALTAQVEAALARDRAVKARDIEVETRDGVVQLSGFVDSEEALSAAVMRARAVQGVGEVRNDLSVREDRPAQEPVADTVIAARVRDRLGAVKLEDSSDVNVEVSEGVVQLSGFVETDAEKVQAGDAANEVEGVRDVENHIALVDERERSPME